MGHTVGASRVVALWVALLGTTACGADDKPATSATDQGGAGGAAGGKSGGTGGLPLGSAGAGSSSGGGGSGSAGGVVLGAPFIPTRIASNADENCVITKEQQLYCWGIGAPREPNLTQGSYVQISMQGSYRCAIAGEQVSCFSSGVDANRPKQGSFAEVRMGLHTACARNTQGMMTCWTDGNAEAASIAMNLPSEPVKSFYVSLDTACAVLVSGSTHCWGFDSGQGERVIPPRSDFLAVGGYVAMYGIAPDGSVVGWGFEVATPEVPPGSEYVQIAAGEEHLAMLRADGTVDSVGTDAATEPADVRFVELSAGDGQTCGITTTGSVRCWGNETGGRFDSPPDTVRAW